MKTHCSLDCVDLESTTTYKMKLLPEMQPRFLGLLKDIRQSHVLPLNSKD